MLCLLASALIHTQAQPDRLRTLLPNGAAILVERMPKQPLLSIQLFASSRYAPETAATHGWRHLLEHLVAKGENGTLDHRLESEGAFLQARTLRDVMQFEVNTTPKQLELGLSAIGELLRPLSFTQADIDREALVLDQELGLTNDAATLASAAWRTGFGASGLDPNGDLPAIKSATPEKLAELKARVFAPSALTLVIAGDVDIKEATQLGKALLDLPPDNYKPSKPRGQGVSGRVECNCSGEARAAFSGPFGGISNAAAMAFAFAVASELDGCFVTYTPSQERGLITLGRTDQSSGVGLFIDSLTSDTVDGMLSRGTALARTWIENQLVRPESNASLRGLLMAQRRSASPEEFLESLDLVDVPAFEQAFQAFSKQKSVVAVGVR